jgi:uncharacterized protein
VPVHRPVPSGEETLADRLVEEIRAYGSTLVAFSGGADSTLVLAAAVRALGPRKTGAVTAASAAVPAAELAAAEAFAESLGVAHYRPRTGELDVEDYQANGPDRCYFCKSVLLDAARRLASAHHYRVVATGTNADDVVAGFRPGIAAGVERGIRTPLADLGICKADVRLLSHTWGLVTWDKPATPCLSSRVAYGQRITPDRLARVERAESAIRTHLAEHDLTVRNLRVRDLGHAARVEVDEDLVTTIGERLDIAAILAYAGFDEVTAVTVSAFRSGRLNDLMPQRERRKWAPWPG